MVLVVHSTMAIYQVAMNATDRVFYTYQPGAGMKAAGLTTRCMDMGSTALRMYIPVLMNYLSLFKGDIYEGPFENDVPSGHGKFLHPNGDYYDGMWKNGLKHGFGIYDLDSVGLRYEGFWIKVGHLSP